MADTTFHSITLPNTDPARVPDMAAEFNTGTSYAVRDYCTYQGILYRCKTAHAAGVWDGSHFQATNLDNEFDDKLKIPPFQASAPANPRVGDLWIDNDEDSPILSIDPAPIAGSTNAVQSGGVRTLIDAVDVQKASRYLLTGDFSTSATYEKGQLVFWYPETFSTSHSYVVGESCVHNGVVYKCITAHKGVWKAADFEAQHNASTDTLYRCIEDIKIPESWTTAHWQATNINVELNKLRESEADTDMIAENYGDSSSYAIGDYVVHNSDLFRCISAVSDTGSWDPDDWTQVKLAKDVSDLNSTINELEEKFFPEHLLFSDLPNEGYISIGTATTTFTITPSTYYRCIIIDCNEGDEFVINNITNSNSARPWAFAKDDGTILLRNGTNVNNLLLIAPYQATKLVINVLKTYQDFYFSKKTLELKVDYNTQNRIDPGKGTFGIGMVGESSWYAFAGSQACHVAIPVKSGTMVTIKANSLQPASFAFLYSYRNVAIGNYVDLSSDILTIPAGETQSFIAPNGSKYLAVNMVSNYREDSLCPDKIIMDLHYETDISVKSITFGTPVTILSNSDAESTDAEGYQLSYFNIIQQSENLFYLYYAAYSSQYADGNLMFAYSTDGIHYTRGFPDGITPPIPDTNILLRGYNHQQVFKCSDPEYPYRLVAITGVGSTFLVKSKDGIVFDTENRRKLYEPYNDTQHCATCKGNVIKLYSRNLKTLRVNGSNHRSREITVAYYDLDGNLLSPIKTLPIEFVYNSAPIKLDEIDDLILPTHFDNSAGDQSFYIDPYTVTKYKVESVETNINTIFNENDKFVIFSPTILTIAGQQYLAYYTHDTEHDTPAVIGSNFCYYKIVPITMVR